MKKEVTDNNKLPNKEMNNFRLMTQLIELKKHKKAYKICEQILKKYPKNGETLAVKGYLLNLLDEKNKEEAFKFIKEGIKNNLFSSFCWYLYGCLYKMYKNYDESLKCFMKAIQLNKYDYKALKEACILLLYLKKYEQFKDLRLDMYKDSAKSVRDKAILIFSFHLLKNYEKCYVIIKQIENDLVNDNDLTSNERHDLLIYMSEILLEGKMYNECLVFLKMHEKELIDKLWFYQMMGLIYLYENNFLQANFFFKEAFSINYENINLLLLILFTENNYYIKNKKNDKERIGRIIDETDNTNLLQNESDKKTLSSLFYLDYKNEHKINEKVDINKNVKVLLHDCILDIYGSDRNLKLLSKIDKNILNDYVCKNLEMHKYDVYTISEFNNFVNINLIDESKFKDNLDSNNVDEYINSLKINLKKESSNLQSNKDIYSYNNVHWSMIFDVDLLYCYKRKFEKNMNTLYYYKIKNLNEEEEDCFESYFKNLQRIYDKSNLLKIFPLHFYNEKRFFYYVEKLLRSLCFQNSLTIFSYFKSLFTFKNIKIILFILHKYIDNYDKTKEIFSFFDDNYNNCNNSNSLMENIRKVKKMNNINDHENNFEKRECLLENDLKSDLVEQNRNINDINEMKNEKINSKAYNNIEKTDGDNEKRHTEELENGKNTVKENQLENFIEEKEVLNNMMGISPLGRESKKSENGDEIKFDKEKKEIKIDIKKVCLTEEEKNEYFVLCLYSFISQIYDYINCTKEALNFIDKGINNIKYKKNEHIKYELIFIKGIIYKRNGNYLESYKYLEQCRNHNVDDRFINTKTVKTCLKCGLIKDAKKTATLFTNPLDNNFLKNINETQCFWLEYNISLSYINNHPNIHLNSFLNSQKNNIYNFNDDEKSGNNSDDFNLKKSILLDNDINSKSKFSDYSKGLNLLHMAHKQFIDIHEDQICFYHYALRKMLFKTYRHLLYMTGNIFSSRFYRKIGKNIIKILLNMHDYDISEKDDLNKNNKKKNKSNTSNQEDNEFYECIKNDPLENSLIYMNTFLSQPNIDLSVYKLNYEIIKRKDKDPVKMINNILKIKSIFPHHNYNHKLAPLISHYLYTVSLDHINEDMKKEITTKLNEIFNLNHPEYNDELLKQIRIKYMNDFIKFFNEHKKGDLCYYQAALEMYIDCNEAIDERLLKDIELNPEKNKLGRCFKFLKFLIKNRKKYPELVDIMNSFKVLCAEVFPLATAFH
ncbi:N-alpha-acetyltransferase 15, NatA auxiliary subunit, putative [Plasmodium gallinaceum]|uniref:N-alpha-acetyltransferase 15, NatA auxiliary subunit, putative n=1 Tax=Plasmodium gallinaceum TaxID=5849 RepID=A0A1J1GX92_PLAGA|nr:N-alpha-acetyltransferase 15, NatA auxiliary subunit, putative [Plasmodium gallinaceum]CRG97068.1 N-alpha-acetyltransferase 15, NatA auxiliary subunit, putative [Plasmodium gallinaceum]